MKLFGGTMRPVAGWTTRWRHPLLQMLGAVLIVGGGFIVAQLALNGMRSAFGVTDTTQLNLWAFVLFVPSTYAAYRIAIAIIERRAATELALQGVLQEIGLGAVAGLGLFSATIGSLWLLGVYLVSGINGGALLLGALAGALTSAFVQELVFRGLVFRIGEVCFGPWWALTGSALLFGAAHLANPGVSMLSTCGVLAAGVLFAAAFMTTRRLWLVIGLHAAWDFANDGIFGVAIAGQSGHAIPGVLRAALHGPVALTGGAFGVEASLVTVLLVGAAGAALLWHGCKGRA